VNKKKYKVITLCGSTKFKDDFIRQQERLTLLGNVVISVGVFPHADKKQISKSDKILLDSIHKQKIEMADEIFVINRRGYIGESTRNEILYAMHCRKPVKYMEENHE
jgi:hypothetical protein